MVIYMKKTVSLLLLCVIILSVFTGCSFGKSKTALVISGNIIDEDVYNYYLDVVTARPQDYGIEGKASASALKKAAEQLCVKHIAFNVEFKARGLSLTNSDKLDVADKVNNLWLRGEKHYNKIKVSRQALNKVLMTQAYEEAIFNSIYDKGVDNEKAESEIKAYFYANYTAFRNICAYYEENTTQQKKQDLIASFDAIATASGKTAEEFTKACSEAGYTSSDIVILPKDSDGYPTNFFMKVYNMETNAVKVFDEYDDCVFCIRKESIADLGEGIYSTYRSTCIEEMYADQWLDTVNEILSHYKIEKENV